ncbi:hypothetical protein DB313_05040 (plasmid) [Borrelia turcica IST7]|uniref:Uncharacterized protein n=1 Tax=Borrelia turcica IST7 TaxID=1104446 RepID=A0A386PP64_9SPIR|nr:hypothetical protein [Borrelia turcica]AYE36865.1 hypothetical protein DB313_05040 [Borrelia turcica IST7]
MYKTHFQPKIKGKIIQTMLTILILALICCSTDAQKKSSEDMNSKLSPWLRSDLLDLGLKALQSEDIAKKVRSNIPTFTTEDDELKALLDRLNGDYKEDFIDAMAKIVNSKLDAEDAIDELSELILEVEKSGKDLKEVKEDLEETLKNIYENYFVLLILCMYKNAYESPENPLRLLNFFEGNPNEYGVSIDLIIQNMNAITNRAMHIISCIHSPTAQSENSTEPSLDCVSEAESMYPYPKGHKIH